MKFGGHVARLARQRRAFQRWRRQETAPPRLRVQKISSYAFTVEVDTPNPKRLWLALALNRGAHSLNLPRCMWTVTVIWISRNLPLN